jgi:hypothetical protein
MNLLKKGFVLTLDSSVINNGSVVAYNMTLNHDNNFEWTSIVIMILVKQYMKGCFNNKFGLTFMGDIVVIDELFEDMKSMGVLIEENIL